MPTNYILYSLKHYPLSLTLAAVITILSLMPIGHIKMVENVPLADKWTHMVMYGVLTLTIWLEYRRHHQHSQWSRLLIGGVALPIIMSGIMELQQAYFTTYRSGEWLDLLANTIGVTSGALIALLIYKTCPRRS